MPGFVRERCGSLASASDEASQRTPPQVGVVVLQLVVSQVLNLTRVAPLAVFSFLQPPREIPAFRITAFQTCKQAIIKIRSNLASCRIQFTRSLESVTYIHFMITRYKFH